uniref:PINc domain-containing protein n=1 Tax=Parastrongyloides trichosuri TaxID=131310 RepID=A0A0N4ZV09_PARTI
MSDAFSTLSSDSTNKKTKRPERAVYKPGMFTKRTLTVINPISESPESQKKSNEFGDAPTTSPSNYTNKKYSREENDKSNKRDYNRSYFNGNIGNKRGGKYSIGNDSNTSLNSVPIGISYDKNVTNYIPNKKYPPQNNRILPKYPYNNSGHFQSNTLGSHRNHGQSYRKRNNSTRSIKSEIVPSGRENGTNFPSSASNYDAKSVCSSFIDNDTVSVSSSIGNTQMNRYASQAPSITSLATKNDNQVSMDSLMMSLESFDWAACMEEENERQRKVSESDNRIDEVDEEKYRNDNEDVKDDYGSRKSIFDRITKIPQSSLDRTLENSDDYLLNKQNYQKSDFRGSNTRINKFDNEKRNSNNKLNMNDFGSRSSINKEKLDKSIANKHKYNDVKSVQGSKEDIITKEKLMNRALKPPPSPRNTIILNNAEGYKSVAALSLSQIKGKSQKGISKSNSPIPTSSRKQSIESCNSPINPEFENFEKEISILIKEIKNRPRDILHSAPTLFKSTFNLADEYKSFLTRDIETTYKKQWELKMWKNGFYKVIDLFKQTDPDRSIRNDFQTAYLNFLDCAITFYKDLITLYENTFNIVFKDQVPWPHSIDLTNESFCHSIIVDEAPYYATKSRIQATAISSVQRHYLSLGDLYRYKSLAQGLKAFEIAYEYCWLASLLSPAVGRSYNSLGLISLYMILQRDPLRRRLDPNFRHLYSIMVSRDIRDQERYLEMIFFYIRSLAAQFPHKGAKEAMLGTFCDVATKVKSLNEECASELFSKYFELNPSKAFENDKEIWRLPEIRATSSAWSFDFTIEGSMINGVLDFELIANLQRLSTSKLYKFSITYLVHCAGILNSKIDMESFTVYAEIGLISMSALLSRHECPISSKQLIELTSFFIFYYATSKNDKDSFNEKKSSSHEQGFLSLRMIMSLFGIYLSICSGKLNQLETLLTKNNTDLESVKKVLPSITIIYNFIKSKTFMEDLRLYGNTVFDTIKTPKFKINTLQNLIDIGNLLINLKNQTILPSCEHLENKDRKRSSNLGVVISLPEEIFLLSFDKLFNQKIKVYRVDVKDNTLKNTAILGNIVRLNNILQTVEKLFISTTDIVCWDEKNENYCLMNPEIEDDCVTPTPEMVDRHYSPNRINNENDNSNKIIVEPYYIIPDTNCFIDFTETIEQLVRSRYFKVTLSHTVIRELKSLSKPIHSKPDIRSKNSNLESDSNHNEWVRNQAKRSLSIINEWFEKYTEYVTTLSDDGKLDDDWLNMSSSPIMNRGQKNDDRIIRAAQSLEQYINDKGNRIKNVAMLTEDKAMRIKACGEGIACKSLSDFVNWLRI